MRYAISPFFNRQRSSRCCPTNGSGCLPASKAETASAVQLGKPPLPRRLSQRDVHNERLLAVCKFVFWIDQVIRLRVLRLYGVSTPRFNPAESISSIAQVEGSGTLSAVSVGSKKTRWRRLHKDRRPPASKRRPAAALPTERPRAV